MYYLAKHKRFPKYPKEAIYKAISSKGNPTIKIINKVAN
jgi:DNA-binding phage protein